MKTSVDTQEAPDSSESLTVGMQAGPWIIRSELGRGGMGVVYAVEHAKIGKRAALKVMHRKLHDPVGTGARMLREAQVVNTIGHPNIVDVFDVGTLDGRPFIVMEQLSGCSLADFEPTLEQGLAILRQISAALVAAHAAGVVHRDLKPDNIFLVDRDPQRVKLLDWGIARVLTSIDSDITFEGQLVGTPRYVSPEQARGERVSPQTDVYSLGVVAYEMLLHEPPFDADTPTELMAMHLLVAPRPPRELWPTIPARLERLLQHMLAKSPAARPTMSAVCDELEAIEREPHAPRLPPALIVDDEEPVVPAKRPWWPPVVGIAAGLAILVGVALHEEAPLGRRAIAHPAIAAAATVEPTNALVNPVLEDCADPSILRDGAKSFLTCTGRRGQNVYPIYVSSDLQSWRPAGWIFPSGSRPAWASGNFWAPELHRMHDGSYAAYFSMRVDGGRNAIGVATATAAEGPYAAADAPLVAPPEGASDAHVFLDGETAYLYYKSETTPSSIWVKPLAGGTARPVLAPSETWEHDNVEAPAVMRRGDWFYLFYSGSRYCDAGYAIGVARSKSPLGPFEKRGAPIVASDAAWTAPGHASIVDDKLLAYHAYRASDGAPACDGSGNKRRHVRIDPLAFDADWPRLVADVPRS